MPTSTNVPRRLRCRVATGTNTLAKRNGPASRSNCRAEPNHARMLTAATVHTANAIVGLIDRQIVPPRTNDIHEIEEPDGKLERRPVGPIENRRAPWRRRTPVRSDIPASQRSGGLIDRD